MTAIQNTFKAVLTGHAHGRHELVVTGDVTEPTNGWTVTLQRAVPQGINPKVLLLKLIENRPTHVAGDIVTTYHVKHQEPAEKGQFTEVTIEGHFSIPVA